MRLEIRYVSEFSYPSLVRESHNVLRARPAQDGSQRVISYRVTTQPPARVYTYLDHWGTWVDAFGIRTPHRSLTVVADSIVEVSSRSEPGVALSLDLYRDDGFQAEHWPFLQPSRHTTWDEQMAAWAEAVVGGADDAREAIRCVYDAVRDTMEYAPGATYVGMDVTDVRAQGKGVCQDFAHLGIALLRAGGIPARYVSGYFYAADQSVGGEPATAEIEVQTHAWLEAALPGWGWWPLDPTNPQEVGIRHVKIGHGRDYDDVLPLRGVYHGDAAHELDVAVRMSREDMTAHQVQQEQ